MNAAASGGGHYEEFVEMIERHWDCRAAYCGAENKVSLGLSRVQQPNQGVTTPRLRDEGRGKSSAQGAVMQEMPLTAPANYQR